MPHISIAAETLWTIGGFPITNSVLTSWLVTLLLFIFAYAATRKLSLVPSGIQSVAEVMLGGLYGLFESVTGKYIRQVFPLLASIFIYVIIANWVGLLPGVGTVGFFESAEETQAESEIAPPESAAGHSEETEPAEEGAHAGPKFTPLLRGATADINTTLAIALVAVFGIQYYGFRNFGGFYGSRFISFKGPIQFFLGILEIISELSKIISFTFRLFGNIFAGEVLLSVIAFLMPFVAPLPFLTLELFVGFIQALVFSMLTAVFLNVAIAHGEHEMHLAHEESGHGTN